MGMTVRRLMAVVGACGVILGSFAAGGVPPYGFWYAGISCLAVWALALVARHPDDFASAIAAIVLGSLVGVPLNSVPCTPEVGLVAGPIVGLCVRLATRPRPAERTRGPLPRRAARGPQVGDASNRPGDSRDPEVYLCSASSAIDIEPKSESGPSRTPGSATSSGTCPPMGG